MNQDIKSIERLWADTYPAGMGRTLPKLVHSSIHAMWKEACSRFADRVAYSMGPMEISYAELAQRSMQFAAWLNRVSGFAPADRVAIMLPNVLHYPIALLGSLRAGAVVVNVNPQYTQRELTQQLKDSGAMVIVISENLTSLLALCLGETSIRQVVVVPQDFSFDTRASRPTVPAHSPAGRSIDWMDFNEIPSLTSAGVPWHDFESTPGDIAFLQYTGGTTGISKGAMLTHGNILSNIDQAHIWFSSKIRRGEEVVLTALPLYHIFALTANCLLFAKCGACNILISNPKDLPTLLGYFRRSEVTILTGVNTLFNGLLHAPGFDGFDFSRFKLIVAGGAAVQEVVARKWAAVTGAPIVEGYGLTEASPFVSCNLLEGDFTGTIGIPIPSTFIEIRDDAGQRQSIGKEGEICIRGPQVMKGYWQRPRETAAVLDEDGWLRSGDVGFINEHGAVTITDRKKDLILVSGFNVYPNEIESVVASHPEVFESAAVGIPDPQTGEAVRVYVVKRSEKISEADLIAHCRTQLTAYKIPRSVVFVDQLPKSSVGKILRRELRERAV